MSGTRDIHHPKLGADNAELLCPSCGGEFLRQKQVRVFARSEDATSGVRATFGDRGFAIDSGMGGNPSPRGDGISISLECDQCGATSELTVSQHKGQTLIEHKASADPATIYFV